MLDDSEEPLTHLVESRISSLIVSAERGDRAAADALFQALYSDLHRMAQGQLAHNGKGLTLGPTTLLHEAYLDMSQRDSAVYPDRGRFMAYAAKVMRALIVDYVRRRRAQKRGGDLELLSLGEEVNDCAAEERELTLISAAIEDLEAADAGLAEVVDLKFFCGFTFAEIATMHGISERTVQRQWLKARIYLHEAVEALRRS